MSTTTRPTAPATKSSKGPLIAMAILTLGACGAAVYFWQHGEAATPASAEKTAVAVTSYTKLEPTFVVNLADIGVVRYMQADVQIVAGDDATQQAVNTHLPALRNRVLLLLGQQTADKVSTRESKEALQKAALAEIKSVLKAQNAATNVTGVLFTSMVVQ